MTHTHTHTHTHTKTHNTNVLAKKSESRRATTTRAKKKKKDTHFDCLFCTMSFLFSGSAPAKAPVPTLGQDGAVAVYYHHANVLGDAIIAWAQPPNFPVGPTRTWPLANFGTAFAIALGYLLFVLVGRVVMPSLPSVRGLYPFKFAYNMVQVMLCSYMCIEAGVRAWDAGYTFLPCNKFNHAAPPVGFILYVFYLSKILDFMDTFFIIAEKRWKQLSFLHVYHHFSIFMVRGVGGRNVSGLLCVCHGVVVTSADLSLSSPHSSTG